MMEKRSQDISMANSSDYREKILPLRQQAEVINGWLKKRLEVLLPRLMEREKFDMWIVVGREYNEDPVMMSLLPAQMLSARRRTILIFSLKEDKTLEAICLMRPSPVMAEFYQGIVTDANTDQYQLLGEIVREKDPQSIGINVSSTFAFGDGLTFSENRKLADALGEQYRLRCRSAERLCLAYLETRMPEEIAAYVGHNEIAHAVIKEAFSARVITPGVTTAADVAWWIRQKFHDLGLRAWFMPSITIARRGESEMSGDVVIMPGDLLHCDVGFCYMGLCTDTQQHAYVLHLDEEEAPAGLRAALAEGNRLQDIHAEEMIAGRTGNQILASIRSRALAEGLNPCVYSHPIGYHGHGAGPTIGLYDSQGGVPGRGDYELFDDTAYAMELNIKKNIPEWDNQEVRIALEQTIVFTQGRVYYLAGRQKEFHLIK